MEEQHILSILNTGSYEVTGQFTWGSNYTFLAQVACDGDPIEAVYKPLQGEQPLWDFPDETLAGREVAAYLVSEALGWELVPPTVFRDDGPFGPGSLQLRVPHDPEKHYFNFSATERQSLRKVALFDLLINNADRKGGHILIDDAGKIWLIDHGISFHEDPKLRTVVWDFVNEPVPADLLADLERLGPQLAEGGALRSQLDAYLTLPELAALEQRRLALLAQPVFPAPPENERAVPWPPV